MIDRMVNLIVLAVVGLFVVALVSVLSEPDKTPAFDRLAKAVLLAERAHDDAAVAELELTRDRHYTERGWRRLSSVAERFAAPGIVMLLLILPLSINYVRHGRFRVWNRSPRSAA